MLALVGTVLVKSFLDSLNPSAIAQELLLLAIAPRKHDVWWFIIGIALANLALGFAIYLGIAALVTEVFSSLLIAYPLHVYAVATIVGPLLVAVCIRLVIQARSRRETPVQDAPHKPTNLGPVSLFSMGAAFCAVELTSALPYFGFMTLLASQQPPMLVAAAFLAAYNTVYAAPLIVIKLCYMKMRNTTAVSTLEQILGKLASYVIPAVLGVVGIALASYGITGLLG